MGKVKLKVKRSAFSFIFLFVSFSTSTFAAPIPISLDQAIQRMLENNLTVKSLALSYEQAQLGYDIAWNGFYLPGVTLNLSQSSNYALTELPFTAGRNDPQLYKTRGYPAGGLTLSLGSYTLFNFFKDRAQFDTAKLNYERSRYFYQEGLRNSRFSVISRYFETKVAQEKLEASDRSVSISQAIAELIESRKNLGKATEDELNSASVDLLNAQVAYGNQKKIVEQLSVSLNTTLNATPETEFKLTTAPPFVPVILDEKHLFEVFKTQSPSARSAELQLATSEINASLAEKSRLPLPTISFSGVTISYANAYGGGSTPAYSSSSSSNGIVEVAASISMSLPIFGPNGFFNEKSIRNAYISRDISEINRKNTMMNGELQIRQEIVTIKQLEGQIKTQRESLAKNSKILDNFFKKAVSGSMDRLQLRDALLQARQSELDYLDSLFFHIREKNTLSEFIGLDRLPGDQI